MGLYLDKFRSGLKEVQSRQILALVTKEKNQGQIGTVSEFTKRVEEVSAQLSSTTISPGLQLYLAELGKVISSETYNYMLDRIMDDLDAAYQELNTIDEVLAAHEFIINQVVINNLETSLNELEARIESLEFISNSDLGFADSYFNTFRTTQRGSGTEAVFIDPKTGIQNSPEVRADIDIQGERLLLKNELGTAATIRSIRQVFDSESTGTELSVDYEDSDINNIIDSTPGTYWVTSTMLSSSKDEDGVITKLEVNLQSASTINSLYISLLSYYPVELVSISYTDSNRQLQVLSSTATEIEGKLKVIFKSITTEKLYLTFRNKNYSLVQFEEAPPSVSPELSRDLSSFDTTVQSIQEDLNELLSSPRLATAAGVESPDLSTYSFYEYLIGFDEISVANTEFGEIGFYISPKQSFGAVRQVGIKTAEKRPLGSINFLSLDYITDTYTEQADHLHGSIEYYILKADYNQAGSLIDSYSVPILPLIANKVVQERLYLSERSVSTNLLNDVGYLQFYTGEDTTNIKVYRNGSLIDNLDDTPSSAFGWTKNDTLSVDSPNQGTRMKYAIQISNPKASDIYTVTYTPALSTSDSVLNDNLVEYTNEGIKYVDLLGDMGAWLGKDNTVFFKKTRKGQVVDRSDIWLIAVLRRNSANVNLSPVVEEYLIATSKFDASRFD